MIPRIVLAYSLAFLLVVVMLANFGLNNVCADVVALWLFDEGSGDTAKDSSGNGHDGKIMSTPKWVDGMFGKALSFNGKDNYVDPGAFSIAYNNAYTQMLWVYPTMLQYGQTAGRGQSWDDQDGDIQLRIEDGEDTLNRIFGLVPGLYFSLQALSKPMNGAILQ